jgi:hypothetical protein
MKSHSLSWCESELRLPRGDPGRHFSGDHRRLVRALARRRRPATNKDKPRFARRLRVVTSAKHKRDLQGRSDHGRMTSLQRCRQLQGGGAAGLSAAAGRLRAPLADGV